MHIWTKIGVWLCRFRQRKGYGVHSPFAYSLIRTVINEPWAYYAYADLKPLRRHRKELASRRVDELLFRLANYFQPCLLLQVGGGCSLSLTYMQAGCRKAQVATAGQVSQALPFLKNLPKEPATGRQGALVFISDPQLYLPHVQSLLAQADTSTVWVVYEPYRNRATLAGWKALQHDPKVVLTFDLYEAGIVLFNSSYQKQNYTVNF